MTMSINFSPVAIHRIVRAVLLGISLLYYISCTSLPKVDEDNIRNLNFGFYTSFAPVSYNAGRDSVSSGFNIHLGYEADLITALESMEGDKLCFTRHPITIWDNIWLKSASPKYDIVGGGITIIDSRTKDATGKNKVSFTSGHIAFRQSLLVRVEDEKRIFSYDNLGKDIRIGVLAGTTGESRLLQLTGLTDAIGVLTAGTRIDTPQGMITADGSKNYFITASSVSSNLSGRQCIYPPLETTPQVIYLGNKTGEAELFEALSDGRIDAIARGEIGNQDYSYDSGGTFVVTALDPKIELGGFTISAEDKELHSYIDKRIKWLTDNQNIGYKEWKKDSSVFIHRSKIWKRK